MCIRDSFNNRCGEDEELRREVESLIAVNRTSNNIFDTPPESLEQASAEGDLQLQSLKVESGYDSLHDDSHFADLMRRGGFPQ